MDITTGSVEYQAGSLTLEQIARVQHLAAIDVDMREISAAPVGEWMVKGNPTPLLGGSAPVDYLTRSGAVGYAALARQVHRWAKM